MKTSAKTALGAALTAGTAYAHLFTAASLETWAQMPAFVTLFKVVGWHLAVAAVIVCIVAAVLSSEGR